MAVRNFIFFVLTALIGFCLVSAKYVRYEPSDSNVLLRHKRSDPENSVPAVNDKDNDLSNSISIKSVLPGGAPKESPLETQLNIRPRILGQLGK